MSVLAGWDVGRAAVYRHATGRGFHGRLILGPPLATEPVMRCVGIGRPYADIGVKLANLLMGGRHG